MKKIFFLLCCLFSLTAVVNKAHAQRVFEGTLMYASTEYHSAAVQKFSKGTAYTGQRMQSLTISGNKAHIIDENLCLHTVLDGEANICYIYSDITNTGISYPLDQYQDFYSQLSDHHKINKLTWEKPGETTYKGDKLTTYRAAISTPNPQVNMTGSLEIWSSSAFQIGDVAKTFLSGADTHGLAKKYVWETKSEVPIIGTLRSIVSAELVAMREYHVDPAEFKLPSSVKIEPDDVSNPKHLLKLYKAHQKGMKQLGINFNESAESVLPQIRSEWSFVTECEASERFAGSIGKAIWGEIGKSLISMAASIAQSEIDKRTSVFLESKTGSTLSLLTDVGKTIMKAKTANTKQMTDTQKTELAQNYSTDYETLVNGLLSIGKGSGGNSSNNNYIMQIKEIRQLQESMKNARELAGELGLDIPQSVYETLDVNEILKGQLGGGNASKTTKAAKADDAGSVSEADADDATKQNYFTSSLKKITESETVKKIKDSETLKKIKEAEGLKKLMNKVTKKE
ncbi:MAG: hypothetical protein KBT20_02025 [Bacteroidales bacterium]|nr:hypothetical protein [Candidatus Liminaster caballi]